ncbi:hypothetical protein ACFSF3_01355 [Vibrio chagasii]
MIKVASEKDAARIEANKVVLNSLAKLDSLTVLAQDAETPACATKLVGQSELMIPMAGLIDKDAELARLDKEVQKLTAKSSVSKAS